jgi:hypothetical protein
MTPGSGDDTWLRTHAEERQAQALLLKPCSQAHEGLHFPAGTYLKISKKEMN